MRIAKLFALEEELNIVALHDLEQEANKTGEYDLLYNKVKNDADAKEAAEKEDEESEENPESTDNGDDTDSAQTDGDGEEESPDDAAGDDDDSDDTVQQTPAEEEFRNLLRIKPSLEDAYETPSAASVWMRDGVSGAAGIVASGVKAVGSLAVDGLKYLGHIGVEYGPGIIRNVFKGVIYVMDRIVKLLFVSLTGLKTFIRRSTNTFTGFKEDIAKLKETIEKLEVKEVTEGEEGVSNKFTKQNIINHLKISDSVDLVNNIKALNIYLNKVVNDLDKVIQDELLSLKHMLSINNNSMSKVSTDLMKFKPNTSILKKIDIKGYEIPSDSMTSYASGVTLPGDVMLIAHLPADNLEGAEAIAEAYNLSSMFLGINSSSFKTIESIDYMSKEQLVSLLDGLNAMCDICLSHKKIYENIMSAKLHLRYNFKNYFNSILISGDRISLKNSMLEMIYLKSHFIDKVYVAAAMDIHDYAIKVMNSSLTYVKKNISVL